MNFSVKQKLRMIASIVCTGIGMAFLCKHDEEKGRYDLAKEIDNGIANGDAYFEWRKKDGEVKRCGKPLE